MEGPRAKCERGYAAPTAEETEEMSTGTHRAGRPLPVIEAPAVEYWEGARRGELMIQRCDACALWVHPPLFSCPRCGEEPIATQPASGLGTVYSFSIMRMPGIPGFDSPYAVAVVELDEQPGLITIGNVLDCPVEDLEIGMRVEVTFEDVGEDIVLPQWRRLT
jgi:uncharacterized OB-fold protein